MDFKPTLPEPEYFEPFESKPSVSAASPSVQPLPQQLPAVPPSAQALPQQLPPSGPQQLPSASAPPSKQAFPQEISATQAFPPLWMPTGNSFPEVSRYIFISQNLISLLLYFITSIFSFITSIFAGCTHTN